MDLAIWDLPGWCMMRTDLSKLKLRGQLLYSLMRFLRQPEKTEYVFEIADSLCALGSVTWPRTKLQSDPDSNRIIAERKLLSKIDLDELASRPVGSLGHEFAVHMKRLGLNPEFFRPVDVNSDDAYILLRMRQTHDLWHIVTGFKTDLPGELALQSLMLSYLGLPLPALLLGGGLMRSAMTSGEMVATYAEALNKGMAAGIRLTGLFAYDWEANWSKRLSDVKRELNLEQTVESMSVSI
jgi:ubiquinone biosynthesis protein COQ4